MKNTEIIQDFLKQLQQMHFFKTITPVAGEEQLFTANVTFIGYFDLMYNIRNLLRACLIVLEYESDTSKSGRLDAAAMLGIILQLLPLTEMELVDENYKLLCKLRAKNVHHSINSI